MHTPDKMDSRCYVLNLVPVGKTVHDEIMASFAPIEKRMLEIPNENEMRAWIGLLDELARDVDRWKCQALRRLASFQ